MRNIRSSGIAAMAVLLFYSFHASADTKKRIAVLDFFSNNIENSYALAARTKIEIALFKRDLHVIERRSINKVLFELGGNTLCRDASCAVKQGKMISADYVVVGDIMYAGQYIITARIVDVHDGRITFTDSAVSDDKKDILQMAERLADSLSKSMRNQVTAISDVKPGKKNYSVTLNGSAGYVLPIAYLRGNSRYGYSISLSGGVSIYNVFIGLKSGFNHLFGAGRNTYAYAVPIMACFRYDYVIQNFYLSPGLSFGASINTMNESKRTLLQPVVNPGLALGYESKPVRIFSYADYYCIVEKKRGIQFFSFGVGCALLF